MIDRISPATRLLAAMLLAGTALLVTAPARAQEPGRRLPFELPPVLDKVAPENLDDLRALENHVQRVLARVMPAVVGLQVGAGQGSGVIVDADGTILTAGHVSGTPDQKAIAVLPSTKRLKAKTLGKNGGIDSGMMKIAEPGPWPYVEMGNSADLKVGQWVIAIGHPGGFRDNRTPVVRVGRILVANQFFIRTDCTLVGGDSGGPLFDMRGRVIGIHSRIGATAITENMHVPIDTYRLTWERLASSESWGGALGQIELVRSAGGKVVFERKDILTADDPGDAVKKDSHCKVYPFRMTAGTTYTLDLISGDPTGKKLDTFLRLEGPDGREVAQDDDGGGFPHSRIVYKPVKDGDFRIIATSFEAKQTGAFTLRILEAVIKDARVVGTVEVLKALELPNSVLTPLLGKANLAKRPLFLHAVVLDEQGDPLPGKEVTFRWETGKETLRSNSAGVCRWRLEPGRSKALTLEFPPECRGFLALTDGTGLSLDLNLAERFPSAGGRLLKTFDGSLTKNDPFDPQRKLCHRQSFEVVLEAGRTYTIDLRSGDFDAYLRLENDAKFKLAEDNDAAGNLNSRIVYTPAATGHFHIVVTTCDPGEHGAFHVTVLEQQHTPRISGRTGS
jgi:serine protease Do